MRKEILAAVVVGILFGAILAYGIWKFNTRKSPPTLATKIQSQLVETTLAASPTPPPDLSFTLIKPPEADVLRDGYVTVQGKTLPNVWLFISSELKDVLTKSNDQGDFEKSISLTEGENLVRITVFDAGGNSYTHAVSVFQSKLFPKASNPALETDNPPTSYIGVITDKTENSLQMKDKKGTIKLISINPDDAVVTKLSDGTMKTLSYSDIGIGDYIAALGYKEQNEVLHVKQIVLTEEYPTSVRYAHYGTVTDITSRDISIRDKDGNEFSIKIPKTAVLTNGFTLTKATTNDLEKDQRIIVSGERNGSSITARILHII